MENREGDYLRVAGPENPPHTPPYWARRALSLKEAEVYVCNRWTSALVCQVGRHWKFASGKFPRLC